MDFFQSATEDLSVTDTVAKKMQRGGTEGFSVSDSLLSRYFVAARVEDVGLVELYSRLGEYVRGGAEVIAAGDSFSSAVKVSRSYTVRITDLFLGPARGVANYLTVLSKGSREDDMLKLFDHGPIGYGRFRRFFPGALRFRNLMVKTVLSTRDKNTRPRIAKLNTTIDVPDKTLQGSATLTLSESTTGLYVPFGHKFYLAPQVFPLWKSGSTPGVALLISITQEGFTVRLVDAADNVTPIAGEITYAVLGY